MHTCSARRVRDRCPPASYEVVAAQELFEILWDHDALLLLLVLVAMGGQAMTLTREVRTLRGMYRRCDLPFSELFLTLE